jgi:hypothetical protein
MASDRYAGWIGQIYSMGRYEKAITRRNRMVGDRTFTEEILPVESVAEYFEHFPLLEIDYTLKPSIFGKMKMGLYVSGFVLISISLMTEVKLISRIGEILILIGSAAAAIVIMQYILGWKNNPY